MLHHRDIAYCYRLSSVYWQHNTLCAAQLQIPVRYCGSADTLPCASAQVNVMPTPDGTAAVTMTELAEGGTFVLDLDTLATRGAIQFKDQVKGPMTTAHPAVQPDGSLINLTSDVRPSWFTMLCRPHVACKYCSSQQ